MKTLHINFLQMSKNGTNLKIKPVCSDEEEDDNN